MKRLIGFVLFAALCMLARDAPAITIDTVPVGNAGNANDPATGFGSVAYDYRIGTTEVTVGQYTAFLNAVAATDTYDLYSTRMATDLNIAGIARSGTPGSYSYSVIGSPNKPVTYVSWGDATRFSNWLGNGQPTGLQGPGTTETGAYNLNGATTTIALDAITRNAGAAWFIPTESEWYKAAYYDSRTTAAGGPPADGHYWLYPMGSNDAPYSASPPGSAAPSQSNTGNFLSNDGSANGYNDGFAVISDSVNNPSQNHLTDVKAYTLSTSPHGAFDMGGNVWEWNEALIDGNARGLRGGSWNWDSTFLQSLNWIASYQLNEVGFVGFRVATVPEASTFALAALGFLGVFSLRIRRRATCAGIALSTLFMLASHAQAVTIDWSPVRNPGNAADGTGLGAVGYAYSIGTYDVTVNQYVEFLNTKDAAGANLFGLYNGNMSDATYGGINFTASNANGSKYSAISGRGERPVNYVNWYDAIRFTNWLNNGQGSGSTETGAYTLNDGTPTPSNPFNIPRNADATVFLPSLNEWYKAAYYDPATNSYFQYPTSSDTQPTASGPTALPNHVNYDNAVGNLTDVGAYSGTTSPSGAFDMGGNVYQWNEGSADGVVRGIRGGSIRDNSFAMLSSRGFFDSPEDHFFLTGFRVATVPESSTLLLAGAGMAGLLLAACKRLRTSSIR